jgi:hypothetical protein
VKEALAPRHRVTSRPSPWFALLDSLRAAVASVIRPPVAAIVQICRTNSAKVAAILQTDKVPAALEALEHTGAPVIDRAMLEKLLGIHRRAAIRLMHRFAGYQCGKTFLIERATLIRELRHIAAGEPHYYETARRERLAKQLDETRRACAARRIQIVRAPDVAYRELDGLPATIRLAPGKLEIACTDVQDLLRQLMELAQAVANDFEKFSAAVGVYSGEIST